MFDGIINAAKDSVPMVIMFFVAGLVGTVLHTLVTGGAFDVEGILQFGVAAALAGFTTSLVFGAAKG